MRLCSVVVSSNGRWKLWNWFHSKEVSIGFMLFNNVEGSGYNDNQEGREGVHRRRRCIVFHVKGSKGKEG